MNYLYRQIGVEDVIRKLGTTQSNERENKSSNPITVNGISLPLRTVIGQGDANTSPPLLPQNTKMISNDMQPLYHVSDLVNGDNRFIYSDDANIMTNNTTNQSGKTIGIRADIQIKRPIVVTKENPENEQYFKKTVPGVTKYSNMVKEGKKTCIIGESLIKRIDMNEFNEWLDKGTAIKRCFPGATASQLNYYIEEVLNEDDIEKIIINIGTNNLSKKHQTEEEIVMEILEIVKKCHAYGVSEIYISGITLRPAYQIKVDQINKLLHEYADEFNYKFIDNSDIQRRHLWKDLLHLNDQGTINLACNFLDSLNKHFYYNNFY